MKNFITWLHSPFNLNIAIGCKRLIILSAICWIILIEFRIAGIQSFSNLPQALNILPTNFILFLFLGIVSLILAFFKLNVFWLPLLGGISIIITHQNLPVLGICPEFILPHTLLFSAFTLVDKHNKIIKNPWGLRLVAVFAISIIFISGISKIFSQTWQSEYHLSLIFNTPAGALPFYDSCDFAILLQIVAWLTVFIEIFAPILLIVPLARRTSILLLLSLFFGISILMKTAFFAPVIFVMLLPLTQEYFRLSKEDMP